MDSLKFFWNKSYHSVIEGWNVQKLKQFLVVSGTLLFFFVVVFIPFDTTYHLPDNWSAIALLDLFSLQLWFCAPPQKK